MKELVNKIKNKQRSTARIFNILMLVSAIFMVAPFIDGHILSGAWALAFLGIFLTITFFILTRLFARRAKKMDSLQSGEKLLAHLELSDEMQKQYAETMRSESKQKNSAIMWVIGILFILIGGAFLIFMDEDYRLGFAAIFGSVLLVVFAASKFFPGYYYRKNMKGDKQILIGEKYAYFNGYFHNWDYPLSGLSKIKEIKKPFRGIHLAYYYTDRTWRHVHEIKFPIPPDFDPKPIISRIKLANK